MLCTFLALCARNDNGHAHCELTGSLRGLLDLEAATLDIGPTRVVVDGKTENARHLLALDPLTLAVLSAHVDMLDRERRDFGPD